MFTMQNWILMLQSALLRHQRVEGFWRRWGSPMDFLHRVGDPHLPTSLLPNPCLLSKQTRAGKQS